MFEKLGIVSNIWATVIEGGARFEDLVAEFARNGFKDVEIRDGDYLRNSEFGDFIHKIETAMSRYSDEEWKIISEKIHVGKGWDDIVKEEDRSLLDRVGEFVHLAEGLVITYAMQYPWLTRPRDVKADNERIIQAIKLSYLFCPEQARLRFVAINPVSEIDSSVTTANLERYRSLLPDYPVVLAVENARQSAPLTLDLAIQGGALFAYDEANIYGTDGTALNPPEEFWNSVKVENLTSVHLKQKRAEGVLPQLEEGFVDFPAMIPRLRELGYAGDLLIENSPTDEPLEDALRSREFILTC